MKELDNERVQAQYKKALYLSFYGNPSSLNEQDRQHIRQIVKHWMVPSIAPARVTFADIVKAHSIPRFIAGFIVFPFRAPYFFTIAAMKSQQPAMSYANSSPVGVRRCAHIDIKPLFSTPPASPKKLGGIQTEPESSPIKYGRFGFC